MQVTCPRGCHQNTNWSYSIEHREFCDDGEIFVGVWGETCDQCGDHVQKIDREAERDYRRSVTKYYLRLGITVALGAVIGTSIGRLLFGH